MADMPRITCVPGFDPLHDFELYAFAVNLAESKVWLFMEGHVVRDVSKKDWATDLVFLEAEFTGVWGFECREPQFGQPNVFSGMYDLSVAEAKMHEITSKFAAELDPNSERFPSDSTVRIWVLESCMGMDAMIAASAVRFSERSDRWTARD